MTIATRIGPVTFTIPASTPQSSPFVLPVSFGNVWLYHVNLRVPPGPSGTTSFQVNFNGITILPWGNPPGWITASDEQLDFPIDTEVDSQFSLAGYNSDVYPHSIYLRFYYSPIALVSVPQAAQVIVPV